MLLDWGFRWYFITSILSHSRPPPHHSISLRSFSTPTQAAHTTLSSTTTELHITYTTPLESPSIHQHNSLIVMPMTQLHQYPTTIPPHGHDMNGQGVGCKSLHHPLHMMLQLWCATSLKKAWHKGQCYVSLPTLRPDSYPSPLHQMSKNSQHQT